MPCVPPSTYRSYAFTFRPRDGVKGEHDDVLVKWIRKNCEYYYLVSEKLDAERHLHCGVFLKRAKTRSNFSQDMARLFAKYIDDDERRVLKRGVRIMYNYDFIQNYLDKDDDTDVLLSNLPERQRLDAYWPPSAEQEKAQAMAATDKYYAKLELLWNTHISPGVECTRETCRDFLFDMMYAKRLIRVLRDDKAIVSVAKNLHRYVTKMSRSDVDVAPWDQ